jgi:POT family proton-dependent oligopeptide transporter
MSYRAAPTATSDMPKGIPYIIGNEAAERFSYYGMRSILVVFMTEHLMNHAGEPDLMTDAEARAWYHVFAQAVYFLPVLGAIVSDGFWGKYTTILRVSLIYCVGHLVLAIDETRWGLAIGLGLIAIGSGGIKPCVSAHVGDQFGASNAHLVERVFSWFYFAINFGSFFATLLIPYLLKVAGPHVAFGLPGVLMFLATFVFWLGRNEFVHVPPHGKAFVKEAFSKDGLKAMGKLGILMLFLAPYYSLFDQTGSAWVLQAKEMDLRFFGMDLLPSQVHAANPILVMILAPLFAYAVYPAVEKVIPLTALRKIGFGFFVVAGSFVLTAYVEHMIQQGDRPTIWWQLAGYVAITTGEVLVSITALEFFYTQGPRKMKSAIMAIKMFAVSVGNMFTALVNFAIQNPDGSAKLSGPAYYLFFAGVMGVTAVIFIFVALRYPVKNYLQDEAVA